MKNITISDLVCYTSEKPNSSSELKTANFCWQGTENKQRDTHFFYEHEKESNIFFELRPRKTEWTGYKLRATNRLWKVPEYFLEDAVIYYI